MKTKELQSEIFNTVTQAHLLKDIVDLSKTWNGNNKNICGDETDAIPTNYVTAVDEDTFDGKYLYYLNKISLKQGKALILEMTQTLDYLTCKYTDKNVKVELPFADIVDVTREDEQSDIYIRKNDCQIFNTVEFYIRTKTGMDDIKINFTFLER